MLLAVRDGVGTGLPSLVGHGRENAASLLRALLRRAALPRWAPRSYGNLVLLPDEPVATIDGQRVPLSPREHALLGLFLRRRGEPIARAELLREVFGYHFDPGTNLVDVHVGNLRKKLRGAQVRLEAVRGVGYVLRAEPDDAA